jgi:hypothetical protein
MKEIVLKLYEFDELSKDSQERIIERERWNVMEQCMDAYDIDYKKSMEAFEDLTDTKVYGWEVGYERYDFSYEFKYKDPIYEHPTDYHRDIFPENLCIKNGIIETSKNIKIERAEAERLWKLIKLFHNGSKFQHDMVLDTTGHKWKINSYKNDILVAGCHRIAYSEMKGIARIRMGLNSYQVTFESCGDHYQIYGRDIQDVMGGVTGGAGVYG